MLRRIVLACAMLTLFAGGTCGTSPIPQILPGRLDVTQTLRDACIGVGQIQNDANIKALITSVESDRQAGITKQAALSHASQPTQCGSNFACFTCAAAIINQVYGQ